MINAGGITGWEAGARLSAALGPCQHDEAEPVVLITGEVVAAVCTSCLAALPPSWGCTDCEYIEDRRMCDLWPTRLMGMPCERHRS